MNYTGPKVRLSRKINVMLTPKAKKVTANGKNYAPGQHGPSKKRSKLSDYGKQLLEKQRLRLQYNVNEKKLSTYYKEATRLTGNTGELLVQLLETRLDALVYRAGFARTLYAAKQLISHGHILVNGKKLNISSYKVKLHDNISVKPKSRTNDNIQESVRNTVAPPYMEVNKADFSFKLLYAPLLNEVPIQCEIPLVVEYYSR